ncbi:MAG: dihydrolipoyl dehydrogenase [Candidatus Binatia bacterium]
MHEDPYDLIVIGGGPGGYTAAIRASQLGLKVALVEKERPGGVCLNWGCIPSKAILCCAELVETLREGERYGIRCDGLFVDYAKVIGYSRKVADRLAKGVEYLLQKNRIDLFNGKGSLLAPSEVLVEGAEKRKIAAKRILLATGSKEKQLPGLDVDGLSVVTSREALFQRELPQSVLIIGGGAVGVEFAYAYNSFGAKTTLVEMMDRLLPEMDEELGRELERALKRKRIRVLTQTGYRANRREGGSVTVTVEGKDGRESSLSSQQVLVAVGRVPLTENLGLERLCIETEKGFIRVDDQYQTSCKGIYAIGDVTGPPLLAHAAAAEGTAAVEMMVGREGKKVERKNIPARVYCQPEVASIGLSEGEARAVNNHIKVGKFPFRAAGKAAAVGHTEGWVKVIAREEGEILGVHMIGKGVTELVAEAGVAQNLGGTVRDLGRTMHAHPTLSEALMEASLAVLGEGINS